MPQFNLTSRPRLRKEFLAKKVTAAKSAAEKQPAAQQSSEKTIKGETKMSFWSTLEADVNKGLEVASVVIGAFIPSASGILTDIATAVEALETAFAKPVSEIPAATVSAVTQAATTLNAVKQAAAAKSSS